jgi:hypothetical protein
MGRVSAAIADVVALTQQPIHRRLAAQVDAFVEQRGIHPAGAMSANRSQFSTASTCSRSATLSARGCALSRRTGDGGGAC